MKDTIQLTHATLGLEIHLTRDQVFAIWPAPSFKGTYVLGLGGAVAPVAEDIKDVYPLVYGRPYPTTKSLGNSKPTKRPTKEGSKHE